MTRIFAVRYVNDDSVEGVLASTELSSNQVRLECDGRAWATVPAFADPKDPSLLRFKCQLPAIASPQQTDVRALDAETGRSLRQIRIATSRLDIPPDPASVTRSVTLHYSWLWYWREIDPGMTIPAR
jgi:hypothetical protein